MSKVSSKFQTKFNDPENDEIWFVKGVQLSKIQFGMVLYFA